ncbi:MAG: 23S rRNA (uracil(1939)-C(5))-methyltransferase RlmD [Candidatus Limiplasma sp.]|nr:23S rRNA (uracil(1939)-C(5))-methyltransferase RlmD [Candidatus Limiplasma sp.]
MDSINQPEGYFFRCIHARECGACDLIHMSYADQLAAKQAKVARLLKPYGRVEPILGMSNPSHYRNKVHAVVAQDRRGNALAGVYRLGSHQVVPVPQCMIEDVRAAEIIQSVWVLSKAFHLAPYDEDRRTGFLRHIMVRVAQSEVMIVLVTAQLVFPGKNAFLKALLKAQPGITTVVQNLNDRKTTMVLGKRDIVLHGKGYIEDCLCGCTFRISPQSFYQVNHAQTEVLYRLAADMASLTGQETVLDAYCGVGTIGLSMAAKAKRLIGVELNPEAVRDALGNARRNGIEHAHFVADDAGRYLQKVAQENAAVDVVLMDPPRSGSTPEFLHALLMLAPKRIVYISCDPTTLARDLQALHAGGYRMRRAVPVDMFPATGHVETVVLMSKNTNKIYLGQE